MHTLESRKLLFQVACSAVVCDGHIDDLEIKELHYIDKSTPYFADIDLSSDIDIFVDRFKQSGKQVVTESIEEVKKAELSPVLQILLLELILRLIYSDQHIEKDEIIFIKSIRAALPLSDDIIIERFGRIDILFSDDYERIKTHNQAIENITTPKKDTMDFSSMYHTLPGKKG